MGAVMVRCPHTGRDIPTGLVTDRKSFEAMPVFFARVYCRFVGSSTNGLPMRRGFARPNRASMAMRWFDFSPARRAIISHCND